MRSEHDQAENVAVIDLWLQTIGSTTWGGRGWDVTDNKERLEAANWMTDQLVDLEEFLDEYLERLDENGDEQ